MLHDVIIKKIKNYTIWLVCTCRRAKIYLEDLTYIHTYYIDSNYEFFLATSTFYLPRIDVEHYDVKSLLSITQRLWYVFSNRRIDPLEDSRSYIFYSWSYNIRSSRDSREKFFVLSEATTLIFISSDLIYYFNREFLFY